MPSVKPTGSSSPRPTTGTPRSRSGPAAPARMFTSRNPCRTISGKAPSSPPSRARPAASSRPARNTAPTRACAPPPCGSRKALAPASRSLSGWCSASPRSTSTHPILLASTTTTRPASTSWRVPPRASTRPTGSSTRWSSGPVTATFACRPTSSARRRSTRCSSRPWAGSGRSGTSPMPVSWRSTAMPSCRAHRSGRHGGGHPSSTPSTCRCARPPDSSTSLPSASSM